MQHEIAEFALISFLNKFISISGNKYIKKSDKREPTVYYAATIEIFANKIKRKINLRQ